MLILETIFMICWLFFALTGYKYFRQLFGALKFDWRRNRVAVGILCVAGPAAMICALVVDFSRPIVA
jgi:hypothetical protein